ncbi:NAD(P)-dependent oxidoreductase [Streptomyces sp. ASQP_92]|uniref:NAD-dependent epimerase/dehydratase family protein n=1 Tax=Streptomyces sp. ASQP_92 TaxID=2979116 RepID=UPI0021BECACB|nr:NAD(P)-dependent oxidoreductase [Streptomyces sp. ASQP_92]MCT9093216.1 NAD(P)-dependent oxidoreductase [Streptomyces sp. ASQP_92]
MGDAVTIQTPLPFTEGCLKVIITGAAGRVGSGFAEFAADRFELTLLDRPGVDLSGLAPYGRTEHCDLADLPRLTDLCRGAHCVLHLAADSNTAAGWESVLASNIVGTYHTFTASRLSRCPRVVFASSVHAVSGYAPGRQITSDAPVNPGNLYGVSKCFGEALGRYMAEREGLTVLAVRIGAFQKPEAAREPDSDWMIGTFVAEQDLYRLLERAIRIQGIRFGIFHAVSDNWFKRLDITGSRELLGYEPAYDFMRLSPHFEELFTGLPHGHSPSPSGGSENEDRSP